MPFLSLTRRYVAIFLLIILAGCSKSNNDFPPAPDTAFYLPVKISFGSEKLVTDSFAYNADNTVKEIFSNQNRDGSWTTYASFVYNSQRQCIGITSLRGDTMKTITNVEYKVNETFVYSTYSKRGVMIRKDTFFFARNNMGQVLEIKSPITYFTNYEVRDTTKYKYQNNNVVGAYASSFFYTINGVSGSVLEFTMEYDDKVNSFRRLFEINPFLSVYYFDIEGTYFIPTGNNNLTRYIMKYIDYGFNNRPLFLHTVTDYRISSTFDEKTGMLRSQRFIDMLHPDTLDYEYTFKRIE
jgi:hypothetical protein